MSKGPDEEPRGEPAEGPPDQAHRRRLRPSLAPLAVATALLALAWALDHGVEVDPPEPLGLRWLRVAIHHPLRLWLGMALILAAVWPGVPRPGNKTPEGL